MDDQDNEYVKFEISDADLEFSATGGINRPQKRMTKNQAIYGIWAESESDDEDDSKTDKKKKHRDYTTGINFVKSDKKLQDESKPNKSGDNEKESKSSKKPKKPSSSGFGGFSGFGAGGSQDPGFAQWEMYTKGVGSKLLQKMGYQPGKGLGKNLQGIIEPIEAKKRPGAGAIGLYGPEAIAKKLRRGDDQEQNEDQEPKDQNDKASNKDWKREDSKSQRKVEKILTKSMDEIIKDSVNRTWNQQSDNEITGIKIIDMTGPEQRILTGLSQLHQSKPEPPKDNYEVTSFNTRFDIPELRQNIERLVILTEKSLIKRKRDYDRNQINIENLNDEKNRLKSVIEDRQKILKMFETLSNFIELLEESGEELTLAKALEKFETFFQDQKKNQNDQELRQQFKMLKIDDLLLITFKPVLRKQLRSWHPFDSTNSGHQDYFPLFERLKSLLTKSKTFELILWDHWNPVVCRELQQWPSMKDCEPIISFCIKWRPLLPKWLFDHFIANNLIPRLKREVDEWNPLTDSVPIHSWIHPWLPVLLIDQQEQQDLSFLFEPIYETIRMKLANALTSWHPSDSSARLILEPWNGVFNDSSMQSFLDVNIVPKLEQTMSQMIINPQQQQLNQWNWVIAWKTLISLNTIVSILERHFFPKWLNVLYVWLNSGQANFTEITAWYQGWKTLMGEDLLNNVTVKDFLKKALIMMDHAVNLNTGLKSFTSYHDPNAPTTVVPPPQPSSASVPLPVAPAPEMEQINFRQLVEMKAAENGILFMPVVNRFESGRQVFKFGPHLIYIDNQVVFYQKYVQGQRLWMPIRIGDLIELCC